MSELPVQTANQCCSRQPSVLESPSFQRKQTNKQKQGHVQTDLQWWWWWWWLMKAVLWMGLAFTCWANSSTLLCCCTYSAGTLFDMHRLVCRPWDWLLSVLEACQSQLHPPAASSLVWRSTSGRLSVSESSVMLLRHLFGCDDLFFNTGYQQQVIKFAWFPGSLKMLRKDSVHSSSTTSSPSGSRKKFEPIER